MSPASEPNRVLASAATVNTFGGEYPFDGPHKTDTKEGRVLEAFLVGRPLGLGYWEGLKLSDAERAVLAEIGHRLGRRLLAEVANVARPDAWPLAARAQQPNAAERIWRDFLR